MNVLAYLKTANLTEAGEDNEWKLDIRIAKDTLLSDVGAMEEMVMLQGGGVRLILTYESNPDRESPKEKREREEREKYDGVMAEKKRREAESAALPLDGAAPEPTAATIALPAVEIVKIGDYQDVDGNRFLVESDLYQPADDTQGLVQGWQIRVMPKEDDANLDHLDFDTAWYPTEPEARAALKTWCENRGYTAVPPEGYGTVYGLASAIYRVAEHEEEEEGFPVFAGFLCKEDGSDARPIKDTNASTTEDAQKLFDEWAADKELPVFGYVLLSSIPVPMETDSEQEYVPEAAPLSETINEGDHIICADLQTISAEVQCVTKINPAMRVLSTDKRLDVLSFDDLDKYWRLATDEEIAAETIPEPYQNHTEDLALSSEPQVTQDAPLSFGIKPGETWIRRKPSAASKGGLDPQPHQVRLINDAEKSCYVDGVGTVFLVELDEKWELAEAPDDRPSQAEGTD